MYNVHDSYCDIQISRMKECGNFEMSTTGSNLIKARDGPITPRSSASVLFYYDPLSSVALESAVSRLRPLANTSHSSED